MWIPKTLQGNSPPCISSVLCVALISALLPFVTISVTKRKHEESHAGSLIFVPKKKWHLLLPFMFHWSKLVNSKGYETLLGPGYKEGQKYW